MLRSLYSAVSGLRANQTMMDVVGNNIANVNTTGFKSSQGVFEDTFSQMLRAAGSPQAGNGGTNPAQVGLGATMSSISTNFAQGATQTTGKQTDIAIQGDGFFVVKKAGQTLFSRAGSFTFDAQGNLTNPDGAIVQGWMATGGVVNTNATVSGLRLPLGQALSPTQTGVVDVGGNLPPYDPAKGAQSLVTSIDIYDSQGQAIPATFTFKQTGTSATPGNWTVDVTVPPASGVGAPVDVSGGPQALVWDGTKFDVPSVTLNEAALNGAGYTFDTTKALTANLGTAANPLTQYASPSTIQALDQNGSAMGTLQSFTMSPDGTLLGVFSNGLKQSLGQVALANFNNPPGLEKVGGSLYASTVNSGNAAIGVANTGGRGTLASGGLEMSNVDLAQEFTNLVVAQRGFEANSKIVTASDEILQDLVNMKH